MATDCWVLVLGLSSFDFHKVVPDWRSFQVRSRNHSRKEMRKPASPFKVRYYDSNTEIGGSVDPTCVGYAVGSSRIDAIRRQGRLDLALSRDPDTGTGRRVRESETKIGSRESGVVCGEPGRETGTCMP